MSKLSLTTGVLCTTLLQACMSPPKVVEKPMEPVFRVNHSSHAAASTYYQLGKFHQERGRLDLAAEAYRHSLTLDAKGLEARNALAAVYSQQGRLDEAKALLVSVIEDQPEASHAHNNLGYVLFLLGDHKQAVARLERALQLDQRSERARNNLKAARLALNDAADAPPVAATAAPASSPAQQPVMQASPAQEPPRAPDLMAPRLQSHIVQIAPNVYELKINPDGVAAPSERQIAAAPSPVVTAAAAVASAAAPAPIPVATPRETLAKVARIQIANGNGVANMASRVRDFLGRQGIKVESLANARPYVQQETLIAYRQGHEVSAQTMRIVLGGQAVLVATADLPPQLDVRLVLGKESVSQMAALDRAVRTPPVLVGDASARQ
jgi:hypothetical protein